MIKQFGKLNISAPHDSGAGIRIDSQFWFRFWSLINGKSKSNSDSSHFGYFSIPESIQNPFLNRKSILIRIPIPAIWEINPFYSDILFLWESDSDSNSDSSILGVIKSEIEPLK